MKVRVAVALMVMGASWMAGCKGGFVMLERPKGQIELRRPESLPTVVRMDPATSSLSKEGIDVTVRYASPDALDRFFEKEEVFGPLAGSSPYPRDTLIFYVKIANHGTERIRVNPADFVLIDNLNIQYAELSADDLSALRESKANVWSFAKTTGDLAPGPYGAPLKVAGALGSRGGRKLHYLMKQVRLAAGYVYPGIAYDGYVAFPRPHPSANSVRLLIHNIKTNFNPADEPTLSVNFEFPFTVAIEEAPEGSTAPSSNVAP